MALLIDLTGRAASWVLPVLFMAVLCGPGATIANEAPKACDMSVNIAGEAVSLFATSSGIHATVAAAPHDPPFCVICCCPCCCNRCCSGECDPEEEVAKMRELIDALQGKDRHFAQAIIHRGLREAVERGWLTPDPVPRRRPQIPRGTGGGGG